MKEPQYRGVNELRRMFLEFFESKGHLAMKSFSLVPHNDNSLLLINSGMAPLKPYFTGQEIPPRNRVTTCQKCIRTGDIENIGKTARHGTFFEMLGNFSFGDYFKTEAIHWTWEFLTDVVGLDPDRLYPSVYLDDDEAFGIWNKEIGIPAERIFKFGKEDNFWEHGSGPCGPCSEVYYDRGEAFGCGKPGCTVGCDCDRYIEVWNNVFTQFDNDGHAIIQSWSIRILIRAWGWSVWLWWFRALTPCLPLTPTKRFWTGCASLRIQNTRRTMRQMCLCVLSQTTLSPVPS